MGIRDYNEAAEQIRKLLRDARAGHVPMGINFVLPSPETIDISTQFAFDWMSLDMEHTLIQGSHMMASLLRAAEPLGVPIFVKPNASDPLLIRDALDAGAHGALLPFMGSAEEMRELVAACRFAPLGNRGFCPVARATNYGIEAQRRGPKEQEYPKFVNEDALFIPLIESLDAVENLDEMLEEPGFEVFHVGMGDLIYAVAEEGKDIEYMVKLAGMLCEKVHEAGKLLIGNLDIFDSLTDTATFSTQYRYHMPYVTDTMLLAYGMRHSLNVKEEAQPMMKEVLAALKKK